MNDLSLWLPALLLSLCCLIYSISARRDIYFPLPKGLFAKLGDQHTVFLAVLGTLIVTAAISIVGVLLGADLRAGGQLCVLPVIGIIFRVLLLCLFVLYLSRLPKSDRKLSLIPLAVIAAGVLVHLVWGASVKLFFASISAFGCLVLFERNGIDSEETASNHFRRGFLIAVTMTFLLAIIINVALIRNLPARSPMKSDGFNWTSSEASFRTRWNRRKRICSTLPSAPNSSSARTLPARNSAISYTTSGRAFADGTAL